MVTSAPLQTPELRYLDFSKLAGSGNSSFLQSVEDRAEARLVPFEPITPEDRLKAFRQLNFYPHGLFIPDDEEQRKALIRRVRQIGEIPLKDARDRAYRELQQTTEDWEKIGVQGRWNGQQAIARSRARFRIAAQGRRAGKTTEAAMEAIACAFVRPRSWVWLVGPTMKLADRAFEKVLTTIQDLGLETLTIQNSGQNKLIVLKNGSKIEGVSAENVWSMAGAAVDLAIIDEAAQILPEVWIRGVLPPLTDRNGQALLISSWEGEGDFFQKKAIEAESDRILNGSDAAWELFQDASWDVNFYMFPQGEQTPALVQASKEMDPHEYLEQFGAIPATSRDRVFPEFKERVHVGEGDAYDYNAALPVRLAIDPSGGANPYCVLAIQDYGDHLIIFDEFYAPHYSTEEIAPLIAGKEWVQGRKVSIDPEPERWEFDNLDEAVVDSAVPEEIRRWVKMGFPAVAVPQKPKVPERVPIMRNWLRDPMRFRRLYQSREAEVLEGMGKAPDDVQFMNAEERNNLIIRVEQTLAEQQLDAATVRELRACARVRVHRRCVNTIQEFKSYQNNKKKRMNMNYGEVPRDWMNHAMDAYGYYLWRFKRFADEDDQQGYDYMALEVTPDDEETQYDTDARQTGVNRWLAAPSVGRTPEDRAHMFTNYLRERTMRSPMEAQSYLEASAHR